MRPMHPDSSQNQPPKWIQIGTAKSGNYWVYQLLQSIARHAGIRQKSFIKNHPIHAIARNWQMSFPGQQDIDHLSITPQRLIYNIGNIFNMPLEDADDYFAQCSHVWVHSPYCSRTPGVLSRFSKAIYIVRDPRDILVSLSHFSFTPYRLKQNPIGDRSPKDFLKSKLVEIVEGWTRHVGEYLKHKDALGLTVVFYERLLNNFDAELKKLLDYLEISLEESTRQKIKEEVSFKTLKSDKHQHLRSGVFGQWKTELTSGQLKEVEKIAGPLMRLLHYPTLENASQKLALPELPAKMAARDLDLALRQAARYKKFWQFKKYVQKAAGKVRKKLR